MKNALLVSRVVLGLFLVPLVVGGCSFDPERDEGRGHGASGNNNTLFYDFECITRPGRRETVNYAVFCESPRVGMRVNTDPGKLIYTLPDNIVVSLPYAEGRQFWVDAKGRITILREGFTADELWRIKRLFGTAGADMKTLEEIKQKLREAQ